MAVLLETSKGDMVVDLFTDDCPLASRNFLKLCKIKYYNDVLFHNVQKGFIAQTGDPTGTGKGGSSVYGVMYGEQARLFEDEIRPHLRHRARGMVGMAGGGKDANASQFYITTGADLDSLDGKHTMFGEVSEGLDVLAAIDEAFVDDSGRPLQNIRIRHTIVLDDPFDDPPQLAEHIPKKSPEPVLVEGDTRLEDDWVPDADQRTLEEIEASSRKNEAQNRAVVLEMIGDLPEADSKPPTNMLFVCKLNPVTTEEDLEIIFSRFGTITSCDIIRDYKTGDSLCYAFIGFDTDKASEDAYFKMNNVLIDDRRIKVDFSQSVHHLWRQFKAFGNKADAAAGNSANGGAPGGGRGGACFECGQMGHMARDCPNKGAKGQKDGAAGDGDANGSVLTLKVDHRRPAQHGGGARAYSLLLEDAHPAAAEPASPPHRSSHSDRRHRDERHSDGRHPDERRRHELRSADRHRDGRQQGERRQGSHGDERHGEDRHRDQRHRDERHAGRDGRHRDERHREERDRDQRDRQPAGDRHRDDRHEHRHSGSPRRDRRRDGGDGVGGGDAQPVAGAAQSPPRQPEVAAAASAGGQRRRRHDSDDDDDGGGGCKKHKKHRSEHKEDGRDRRHKGS